MVCLRDLYSVVRANPTWYDSAEKIRIPEYRENAKSVVAEVPEHPGVYLWGRYDRRGYWQSIYLGLAGLGGESYCLQSRLLEELIYERSCLWRICRSQKHILNVRENGRSARARAIRKEGSTHIIWVTTPKLQERQVRDVESELIEAFNPIANVTRPAPPPYIQKDAALIYNAFRKVIHSNRHTACPVVLK